jgi:hypothetical protein
MQNSVSTPVASVGNYQHAESLSSENKKELISHPGTTKKHENIAHGDEIVAHADTPDNAFVYAKIYRHALLFMKNYRSLV